jgi:hypothetical protein
MDRAACLPGSPTKRPPDTWYDNPDDNKRSQRLQNTPFSAASASPYTSSGDSCSSTSPARSPRTANLAQKIEKSVRRPSVMLKARVYTDVNVQRPKEYWDYETLTVQWDRVREDLFLLRRVPQQLPERLRQSLEEHQVRRRLLLLIDHISLPAETTHTRSRKPSPPRRQSCRPRPSPRLHTQLTKPSRQRIRLLHTNSLQHAHSFCSRPSCPLFLNCLTIVCQKPYPPARLKSAGAVSRKGTITSTS